MFETDSLPPQWVEKCNLMDEIWVPTEFNLETFRRAGVTTRLTKTHGGIDTQCFHPRHKPLEIPKTRGTVFLSIFEWSYRKGWDVLLQAWANAFTAQDDVCLVLRVYPLNSIDTLGNQIVIERYINTVIEEGLNLSRADLAPIIVLGDPIGEEIFRDSSPPPIATLRPRAAKVGVAPTCRQWQAPCPSSPQAGAAT